MSSSEESELKLFLKHSKSQLHDTSSVEIVHAVIGNEASDLDSVVSALVYAFFLYKKKTTPTSLFVPVLNIPSEKYRLAGEVPFALEQHGITTDLLTFRNQINLEELHSKQRLQLTLVDHNVLRGSDKVLSSAVCEVIDHHKNEREETANVSCLIEPVGSCCTLIAEKIFKYRDITIPEELLSLLYATILLDTVCLSESANRMTPKDVEIIEILENKLGKANRRELFEQLQTAKMDVSGLSTQEVLSKDVKTVSKHDVVVLICSVPTSLQDLFSEGDVDETLSQFSAHQGAAAVIIMALYFDQKREPHRELAVYSEDSVIREQLVTCLANPQNPIISSEETAALGSADSILVFTQTDVTASRKKVLPLIVGFMENMNDPEKGSGEYEAGDEDLSTNLLSFTKNIAKDSRSDSSGGRDSGEATESWSGISQMEVKQGSKGDKAELQDPFDHHVNVLLESNLDGTTSTTPASGLSSRSYSPANEGAEGQTLSAPGQIVRHLLPEAPANSPMECQGLALMPHSKHQELPSFNSIEMVQKIRDKKSSYDGGDDEISLEVSNYPYTPTNSFTELGDISGTAKRCVLPNFMDASMMQKIEEKKAVLENIVHSNEGFDDTRTYDLAGGSAPSKEKVHDLPSSKERVKFMEAKDVYVDKEYFAFSSENSSKTSHVEDSKDTQACGEDFESAIQETESAVKIANITSKGEVDDGTKTDSNSSLSIKPLVPEMTADGDQSSQNSDSPNTARSKPVMFGDGDLSTKLKTTLTPNNVLSSTLMSQNSSEFDKEGMHFEDDSHNNIIASSGDDGHEVSSCDDMMTDEMKRNDHVDSRVQGLVIHAANMEEAALKFTESVIETAVNEYKALYKNVQTGKTVSYGTSGDTETQKCPAENCDNVLSSEAGRTLYLGSERDESCTDYNSDNDDARVTSEMIQCYLDQSDSRHEDSNVLILGEAPGESQTDNDKFEEHMMSRGMDIINVNIEEDCDITVNECDDVHGKEKAMNFVHNVIKEAIEVCRQEPDGSTVTFEDCRHQSPDGSCDVAELKTHPVDGSTVGNEIKDAAVKEETLRAKQRHHLECVEKTLNIDLSFSSEDEEEIKALKDQIPEDLASSDNMPAERPTTLSTTKKKIMPNLDLLNDNDIDIAVSPISTDDDIGISVDDEKTPDDLTTPDVLNNSMFDGELEWQSTSSSTPVEPIPEYTAREELEDERHWRSVQIGEKWYKIDMKVIEPYKKVLSHGGYYGDGFNAIVVFTACYLPDRRRRDYHYVMDNLFLYVISTLELLVVEDYMIVYFHGATPRHKMPSLRWLKRCYDMIDRRLRKNLKGLLIVHPTIWLKTLVFMMKPFVSSKFSSKLRYIKNLEALSNAVPTEYIFIPEEVQKYDEYWSKPRSSTPTSST